MITVDIQVNGERVETIEIRNVGRVRDLAPQHADLNDTVCLYDITSSKLGTWRGNAIHERADGIRSLISQAIAIVTHEDPPDDDIL